MPIASVAGFSGSVAVGSVLDHMVSACGCSSMIIDSSGSLVTIDNWSSVSACGFSSMVTDSDSSGMVSGRVVIGCMTSGPVVGGDVIGEIGSSGVGVSVIFGRVGASMFSGNSELIIGMSGAGMIIGRSPDGFIPTRTGISGAGMIPGRSIDVFGSA